MNTVLTRALNKTVSKQFEGGWLHSEVPVVARVKYYWAIVSMSSSSPCFTAQIWKIYGQKEYVYKYKDYKYVEYRDPAFHVMRILMGHEGRESLKALDTQMEMLSGDGTGPLGPAVLETAQIRLRYVVTLSVHCVVSSRSVTWLPILLLCAIV